MMKKNNLVWFFFFFFISCSTLKNSKLKKSNESEYVSLINIISNPEKYHNKDIIVDGYFIIRKEGDAVYLTKTDYENGLFKNAIYLLLTYSEIERFDIEPPFKGYVKIEGRYNMNEKGSYKFYSGAIEYIKSIRRLYKVDGEGEEYNMN